MHRTLYPFILAAFSTLLPANEAPRSDQTVVLDATSSANIGIETVEAEEQDFQHRVLLLGKITHTCEGHSVLSTRIPGRVTEVFYHQGEFVEAGQVIARIESRQPGNPPPIIDLKAPAKGLIIRSDIHLGAPVEPDKELLEIYDLSSIWVIAKVPQHHAEILRPGLTSAIHIPALGSPKLIGNFLRLDVEADAASGTVDAIFQVANPENTLRPGMRAELSLVRSQRAGVLTIPREALQGDRSNRFVFIKDYELENAYVRTPVTVGEISGDSVEIRSGLFPGDELVTQGSYALSFAGKGSASLKEALDAAHGHPHNEDGTEMSAEQIAASGGDHKHSHDHESNNSLTIFLAITCAILLLLLLASPFIFKSIATAKR